MSIQPKYYLWAALVVVALIGVGYAAGQVDHSDAKAAGNLEIRENYYDFGTVGLDIVEHTFTVKNTGAGPLTIQQLSTSCGCTAARIETDGYQSPMFGMNHGNLPPTDVTLAPGEEATIVAAYNPLAHGRQNAAGRFHRVVYVQTENPRDEYQLTFDVTVDPDLYEQKDE